MTLGGSDKAVRDAHLGFKNDAKRAQTHAEMARARFNKNESKLDVADQAELLATISIAESLATALNCALWFIEVAMEDG